MSLAEIILTFLPRLVKTTNSNLSLLVFPKILEKNVYLWQVDNIIVCSGKISDKDDEVKILCDQAVILSRENMAEVFSSFISRGNNGNNSNHQERQVIVRLDEPLDFEAAKAVKEVFLRYQGNYQVELWVNRVDGSRQRIKTSFLVDNNEGFLAELAKVLGDGRVVVGQPSIFPSLF